MMQFCEVEAARSPLLDRFYREQNAKVKFGRKDRVFALRDEAGQWLAALRMVEFASGAMWLRNMMVAREWRNQGLGKALLDGVVEALPKRDIYCFSLIEVTEFYAKQGFRRVQQAQTAEDVWAQFHRYKLSGRDWILMKRAASR